MTSNGTDRRRLHVRMDSSLVRRIDSWAASERISRSEAIAALVNLGLDADAAGVAHQRAMQDELRKELRQIRGLARAAIDAGDLCVLAIMAMTSAEPPSSMAELLRAAIEALPKYKRIKRDAGAGGE